MVITISAYVMMAIFMYVIMKKKCHHYSFSINSISFAIILLLQVKSKTININFINCIRVIRK